MLLRATYHNLASAARHYTLKHWCTLVILNRFEDGEPYTTAELAKNVLITYRTTIKSMPVDLRKSMPIDLRYQISLRNYDHSKPLRWNIRNLTLQKLSRDMELSKS